MNLTDLGNGRSTMRLDDYRDMLIARALPDYRFIDSNVVEVATDDLAAIGYNMRSQVKPHLPLAPHLFDFQAWVVERAFQVERFAAFMLTGLGKTAVQLEWARLVADHADGRVLIVAPLNVCAQTIGETVHFYGDTYKVADCTRARLDLDDWLLHGQGVAITNYEKLDGITDPLPVAGVVLDESSMLRSIGGARKWSVMHAFQGVRFKLCCSATPAPNDRTEYAQHATFLGVVRATKEYLTAFFRNDGHGNWDFKTHAYDAWVANLASWAVFMHDPARWRFDALPDMPTLEELFPRVDLTEAQRNRARRWESGEQPSLFGAVVGGITSRTKVQQIANGFELVDGRVERFDADKPGAVMDLIRAHPDEQVIVWVHFDAEGDELERRLVLAGESALHLSGQTSIVKRTAAIEAFRRGDGARVLVLKPAMFATGLNLQACTVQIFSSVHDSFERYFQCVRRSYRFGQTKQVRVYVPLTELCRAINDNVMAKQATFTDDADTLELAVAARLRPLDTSERIIVDTEPKVEVERTEGRTWTMVYGDSVAHMETMPDACIDHAVFSPPFPALFAYSRELGDVANVRGTAADTSEHQLVWRWFAERLLRVMKPGRIVAIHCKEILQFQNVHGHRWAYDYPSEVRAGMEVAGFHYQRRITIAKNPQALRHGSRVATSKGWRCIEDLAVGDDVIGVDGLPTEVVGVWPQGLRPMYRVTTNDGAHVDCDGRHLWTVTTAAGNQITVDTETICAKGPRMPSGKHRWELPTVAPIEGPPAVYPLDPYLVGVLIGDGCLSLPRSIDVLLDEEMAAVLPLPDGCVLTKRPKSRRGDVDSYGIGHPTYHYNPVLFATRKLGMQGCRAWEKFIPDAYMGGSVAQRLAVLQGLMDTDGTAKVNGQSAYGTTSKRLAEQVVELVGSLGGLARTVIEHDPVFTHNGERRFGRDRYIVSVRLRGLCPFRLTRKAARWSQVGTYSPHRWIESVERLDIEDEATCITVAHPSGLFVTEGHIVTHNSEATRNKETSLLHITVKRNALNSFPQAGEYLLVFTAPGEPDTPVPTNLSFEQWTEWANSIWPDQADYTWTGIRETDVLNTEVAKERPDERHCCPLQLGLIERTVRLWSNPGELVFSPFAGIGSEGVVAVEWGRRFLGIELKESYYRTACNNLASAEHTADTVMHLFDEEASA